jgi:hypothetical protein
MKKISVATCCLLFGIGMTSTYAQESASISGTIKGPYEDQVQFALIQVTNLATGEKVRSQGTRDGSYEILNLSPGKYSLKVSPPCCLHGSFANDEIDVAGATTLDIELEEGDSFNTIGDDPGLLRAAVLQRQTIPDEPPPRLPGGTPDLSGLWLLGEDPFPEKPEALPWAQELRDERVASNGRHHPHNYCLPGSPPIAKAVAPFLAKFVHKDEMLVMLLEDAPGYRQIFIDGREHPEWPNPSWMGHSIAHWEDDVLVIDTVGYNDRGWLPGAYPRSEELHVVERYRRADYGRMQVDVTFEDPKVFRKPWSRSMVFDLAPQEEVIEFVCENNKWAQPAGE